MTCLPKDLQIPSKWNGCIIPIENNASGRDFISPPSTDNIQVYQEWTNYTLPTYNQCGPSCVGESWANWLECMLRRYVGKDILETEQQIDGYAIWKYGVEKYHDGNYKSGLLLEEGAQSMIALGLIPPESQIKFINRNDYSGICKQLFISPLVQAQIISDAWFKTNTSGQILEDVSTIYAINGGHATLFLEFLFQNNELFPFCQNSWGMEWGYYGYFLMSYEYWIKTEGGPMLCYIELPNRWDKWDGWKKYIKKILC